MKTYHSMMVLVSTECLLEPVSLSEQASHGSGVLCDVVLRLLLSVERLGQVVTQFHLKRQASQCPVKTVHSNIVTISNVM